MGQSLASCQRTHKFETGLCLAPSLALSPLGLMQDIYLSYLKKALKLDLQGLPCLR